MDDNHVRWIGIASFQQGSQNLTTPVHVRLWFYEGYAVGFHLDFACKGCDAFFFPGTTRVLSQIVRHPEAQIVSLTGIRSTRIPQTNRENVSPPWDALHLSISPLF